jgi:hypothetical protein
MTPSGSSRGLVRGVFGIHAVEPCRSVAPSGCFIIEEDVRGGQKQVAMTGDDAAAAAVIRIHHSIEVVGVLGEEALFDGKGRVGFRRLFHTGDGGQGKAGGDQGRREISHVLKGDKCKQHGPLRFSGNVVKSRLGMPAGDSVTQNSLEHVSRAPC